MQVAHLTKLFPAIRLFCLAVIAITRIPAYGQTPRPASVCQAEADCQTSGAAPSKGRAINLRIDTAKTTRVRLPKGVTSFVIPVSASTQPRCFTLENGDVATKGTFSIATANKRLAVDDADWNVVAGAVRFRQKRQFYLSLVGVEAKFVRLTFQIDGLGKAVQMN